MYPSMGNQIQKWTKKSKRKGKKTQKLSPSFLFPAVPPVTHHCVWITLTVQFCLLMTGVPGSAEPQAALCSEGDPAMITFSTEGVKTIWDPHGPEQTLSVYRSGSLALPEPIPPQCSHPWRQQHKRIPIYYFIGRGRVTNDGEIWGENQDGGFCKNQGLQIIKCRCVLVNAGFISAMHRAWEEAQWVAFIAMHACIKPEKH